MSVIKKLSLYEFTLWGRDLVSVVRIRKSRHYRGFFLKKIDENFVGTLETARVIERGPYREVRLYWIREFKNLLMCRTFGSVIVVLFVPDL